MISHEIEGGYKETSDVGRVSGITDAADVSFSLAAVGSGGFIRRIGGWIGITLVLQNADAGEKSVGSVRLKSDTEATRGITEVPSLDV